MMRFSRSLTFLLLPVVAAMSLTGCAEPAPKPMPPVAVVAATPEQAVDLQSEFMKLKPNARVGHVSAVNASASIAAVAGIPINEVRVGDSVQFVDAKFKTIANGTVNSVDSTHSEFPFLIVDYKSLSTGRNPITGDLVVYLPTH